MKPKAEATEEKMDKSYFIKIKNFCPSKDTIKEVKTQSMEWDKICANHICDKEHVSRLYKELFLFSNEKSNNPVKMSKTFE